MAVRIDRVRAAAPADAPALVALRRQVEETHARLLPDYFQVARRPRPAGGEAARGWTTTWVADLAGVIVGYVVAKIVETPADPVMVPCRRLQIVEIGVEVSARRSGVGRRLMEVATDWGRRLGANEVVLTVWSQNRAALGLYRYLGFQQIASVMRKTVGEPKTPARKMRARTGPKPASKRSTSLRLPAGTQPSPLPPRGRR